VVGRVEGKVAIVTGAGSGGPDAGTGIGQAIALVLAREGASVLVVDRDGERVAATVSAMAEHPGRGEVFVGDVTDEGACRTMVAAAQDAFGGLDVLVNNAAISRHVAIVDTSVELYDQVLDLNLKGSFLSCKHAVPALQARGGGSIVMIGSIAALRDTATTHPAYCASKAGQLGLMVDLAGEYGRDGIRVNAVLPGIIASPLQASFGEVDDDVRARLNLLGRMGTAWDIAHAVLFLCSDEAAYLTGVTLPVDGGATVAMPSTWRRGDR
jgi:NAD(P)-dependent dehydrogenase (short-subunit alcohol dehydrogenase family)